MPASVTAAASGRRAGGSQAVTVTGVTSAASAASWLRPSSAARYASLQAAGTAVGAAHRAGKAEASTADGAGAAVEVQMLQDEARLIEAVLCG